MKSVKIRIKYSRCFRRSSVMVFLLCVSYIAGAEESYSPYANQSYPVNVYWGDTHLHTNLSVDANVLGNRALTPDEAYRFAQGEAISGYKGTPVRLRRPLDFLVVSDHAANIGVMAGLRASDPALLETDAGKRLLAVVHKNKVNLDDVALPDFLKPTEFINSLTEDNRAYTRSVWERIINNAERYNNPGKFTAFIGYEWTSIDWEVETISANLHRNVIFKDGKDKVSRVLPFSYLDNPYPEGLWRYFEEYQQKTNGDVLAIPHNSNLSYGRMFSLTDYEEGQPLTQNHAKTRSRWEPLMEVTQIKGDSETHPILSPMDEFADYETWNSWLGKAMVGFNRFGKPIRIDTAGWEKREQSGYARSALKLGLDEQFRLGVNPFKFGMIGSTDAHNALSSVEENNFFGKFLPDAPSADRMFKEVLPNFFLGLTNWQSSAAGYAAVWAEENTRESLFDAMRRKEVYASTGPRITVRFFGGWHYDAEDARRPDLARTGYRKGVPMGGDLTNAPKGKSPNFLIRAIKDPDGANLDRVQVIKGWRDDNGDLHEKIYNVALSDNRQEDENGKAPLVGSTVNVKDASYTNRIGDPELAVVWQDPNFDKEELAFYYVRVLEIPTPRWTAYDAKFFGIKDVPEDVPMIIQERAYTSPIWYTP